MKCFYCGSKKLEIIKSELILSSDDYQTVALGLSCKECKQKSLIMLPISENTEEMILDMNDEINKGWVNN